LLVNDPSYWKTEEIKYDKKVGEECIYSPKTLFIKGVEEYDKCMESKFHGNKLKKVAMMALTSIYSIGTMPTAHVIKHAREIEQNNMKAVTVPETEYVTRPPTLEEMIPVAREIVRNEVRNEFAEFLRKKAAGNPQQ
jgi:ribosomal protein S13